ncbi:MAG: transcriptional repressor, partial [Verrucomicrobia bacterium]|nr:transcriptional repressor [Verrucomicrobiota bacterium]
MRHSHPKEADPLRQAGLKSTPGRRAVLDILAKSTSPLSPEQIHAKVGSEICDRATIYRILESLGEAGLVQRLILEGKTLYLP